MMPADTPPLTPEELDAIASRRALAWKVFITSPNADLVFDSLRDIPRLIADLKQARADIKQWKEAYKDAPQGSVLVDAYQLQGPGVRPVSVI